jgi:hypothetical protein
MTAHLGIAAYKKDVWQTKLLNYLTHVPIKDAGTVQLSKIQ